MTSSKAQHGYAKLSDETIKKFDGVDLCNDRCSITEYFGDLYGQVGFTGCVPLYWTDRSICLESIFNPKFIE